MSAPEHTIAFTAIDDEKPIHASSIVRLEIVPIDDQPETQAHRVTYCDQTGHIRDPVWVDAVTYGHLQILERQELERLNREADAHT